MAVTAATSAPYAPPSAIMEVVNRFRRGLPPPITAEVLGRAGISDSLIPRTLQALRVLDLITDDGAPTPVLEGLRRSPEPEFQKRLTEWLNTAYADVLAFIDPATADEGAISDAFRSYNPVGQQPRMVTLYIGLYTAAGVRKLEKGAEKSATPRTAAAKPRARAISAPAAKPLSWIATAREKASAQSGMPPALAGLMASLPPAGTGWTKETRDKFVALFGVTLDYSIPIITQAQADKENTGGA
ncbi:MAG TPA: DUF5343 domain-containing protein [Rhizomicrobium sp.]|jgi:hypothetical protein|nr:DUF5343 domain-containing protein [Rhizomicrobium sp.]